MPMHDWTRVDAGIYHDFHNAWITELRKSLNALLPEPFYALGEQRIGFGSDVLTLQAADESAWQTPCSYSLTIIFRLPWNPPTAPPIRESHAGGHK